jgi:hypothetical protein
MELPNVMLPHRLATIRSLNIDLLPISLFSVDIRVRWKHSCTVFSMMEQLQSLHVKITHKGDESGSKDTTDTCMISILQPLLEVKAQDFEVTMKRWPKLSEAVTQIIGETLHFVSPKEILNPK